MGGAGRSGGTGVALSKSMLTNQGSIMGGRSAARFAQDAGSSSLGVSSSGESTVNNFGFISGGLLADGTLGHALTFSGGGNRLVVQPGASFVGGIRSTSATALGGDTLELAGASGTTASPHSFDLSNVSGFRNLIKSGDSVWSVTGAMSSAPSGAAWRITGGTLQVNSATASELVAGSTITLAGGTLRTASTAGTTVANALNVELASTLDNAGYSVTYSGALSGHGSLSFVGTGSTTLLNTNSFTGGISVREGALSVDSSATLGSGPLNLHGAVVLNQASQTVSGLSGTGALTLNGTAFTVNSAQTNTFGGTINGSGSLMTAGTGTLTLNGVNTFSGGTTVASGTLAIGDASSPGARLAGGVNVQALGTLMGHGRIDGLLSNSGNVAPGGSVGILTVADYTQSSSGTLSIEVTPSTVPGTGHDQLNVLGSAQLAGTLAVKVGSGRFALGSAYNIVHAGAGLSGTFASVSYEPAFASYILPQLTYGLNDVYLRLQPGPEVFSSAQLMADSALGVARGLGSLHQRVLAPRVAERGVWLDRYAEDGSLGDSTLRHQGLSLGLEMVSTHDTRAGVAVSLGELQTRRVGQQVSVTSQGLSLYGVYEPGPWRLAAALGAGSLRHGSTRQLGETGLHAIGRSTGAYLQAQAEASVRLEQSWGVWSPYAGLSWVRTRSSAFTETGAQSLSLSYSEQTLNLGQVRAGVMVEARPLSLAGASLMPWFRLGGVFSTGASQPAHEVSVAGASAWLRAPQVGPLTDLGLGLSVSNARQSLRAGLSLSTQFASGMRLSQLAVQLSYRW